MARDFFLMWSYFLFFVLIIMTINTELYGLCNEIHTKKNRLPLLEPIILVVN